MKSQSENADFAVDSCEWSLLNDYQRAFPIVSQPYADVARQLGVDPHWVIEKINEFKKAKLISRVGPVFRPNALGVSTLAAVQVSPERIESVAEYINSFSEVNHNYERENLLNLWFVVTAPSERRMREVLSAISDFANSEVHDFRLLEEFRIDLGFSLKSDGREERTERVVFESRAAQKADVLTEVELKVANCLQEGIEVTEFPFQVIAKKTALSELQVLSVTKSLIERGTIRRFGLVLAHRSLGYTSNAMCVWQIPDNKVKEIGQKLASFSFVNLCYQRRTTSDWPFNLYCMIHGKDRHTVEKQIVELNHVVGSEFEHKVLFSTRAFKQRGANYSARNKRSLTNFERKLIDKLQHGIPVSDRPFSEIANELNVSEEKVCESLLSLRSEGLLTRFGPMFNVEKLDGEFTLVAMSVPSERYNEVNEIVNSFVEVAHNYEREHELNMWFVTAVVPASQTSKVLEEIEKKTGLKTYAMPKLKEFYLDLRLEVRNE